MRSKGNKFTRIPCLHYYKIYYTKFAVMSKGRIYVIENSTFLPLYTYIFIKKIIYIFIKNTLIPKFSYQFAM